MRDDDDRLLGRTLALARKGGTDVRPNPMVGAVIASNGHILGEGFHERYGGPHAESHALAAAGERAEGATLYCNLEPCSFDAPNKHQPPCTRAIIGSGVRRVVIAQLDPNPRVRGSGVAQLRSAGIDVEIASGDRSADAWRLNDAFNTRMALERPYVHLKSAISIDGQIAASTGKSSWISDEHARHEVHAIRARMDAVAVGVATVIADDPRLTVRIDEAVAVANARPIAQPRPVVFDSSLRIPLGAKLVRDRAEQLIVLCGPVDRDMEPRRDALVAAGVTVVPCPVSDGVDLRAALDSLLSHGISSILVEGGSRITTSFVRAGLFDRLTAYVAPILIGAGVPMAHDLRVDSPADALRFEAVEWRPLGDQQVFTAMRAGWLASVREVCRVHGTR